VTITLGQVRSGVEERVRQAMARADALEAELAAVRAQYAAQIQARGA
jgi:hypothetical protein